jgi:starch-binding outer membrane protein, SusD/RagB family
MYKIITRIAVAATLVSAFTACKKDFLERPPLTSVNAGKFYRTSEEVLAGTSPLYNIVWFDYNDKSSFGIGDARAGNMISNDWNPFYQFSVPATNAAMQSAYQSFYKIIAQSNVTIENIDRYATAVPDNVKNYAKGEARFMRGLAYAYLVRLWGELPIIYDNVAQGSDTSLRKNTVESIWDFIIRDFRYASTNLTAKPMAEGRLSRWSAEGMLAKMYLTRAGVGQTGNRKQQDLDSARFYAKSVIENSGAKLLSNYYDLFKSENNNSTVTNSETLFALQWLPLSNPWGVNNSFQAYMAYDPKVTESGDGWGRAHGASADLVKYYISHPDDSVRRKASFMFNQDTYPELGSAGVVYDINDRANVKKYIIGTPARNGGGTFMTANIKTYMLRLSEVYLIYAEALLGNQASTSDPEALKYFNMVRTRAGVAPMNTLTFDDIFSEKRIEFAMEGVYWYELVRLYYFNKAKALDIIAKQDKGTYTINYIAGSSPRRYTVTYTSEFYPASESTFFLPIPANELLRAPNLLQPAVPFDFSKLPD